MGKEIEGLGMLVRHLGAKAVIATLWSVADCSTGKFMQTLYRLHQEQGLSKAEALRQAQLNFLYGKPYEGKSAPCRAKRGVALAATEEDKFTPDPQRPYTHPYYWAPFILMGNWR